MTSISEDPTLPLDLDGTSNQLSNSHFGNHDNDTTDQDVSASLSSELEHPGTFRNLTSMGKMSPHRTRTMKDQENLLGEFKKENFGLKLRIYHLEEALRKRWGTDDGWKMNIELQVQMADLNKKSEEKDRLLMQAKAAIDHMEERHQAHIREMQQAAEAAAQTGEVDELRRTLQEREEDLEQAKREADENSERMLEMQRLNDNLAEDLAVKDQQLEEMERELENVQRMMQEREAAVAPPTRTSSRACQTVEPLPAMLAQANAALEAARAQMDNQERDGDTIKAKLAEKDRQIKQLELELLSSSQKLAADADEHAREMQGLASELDCCRGRLRDAEDKLRDKEAELCGVHGDREGLGQQVREVEAHVQRLQPLVEERDREIQDLQQRLSDGERRAREREREKDNEIADLKRQLRDAESQARQAQPDLNTKQREIERLSDALRDREDEVGRLKERLRETEEALSHARKSAHRAGVDNREQNEALKKLADEMDALKAQLARQRDGTQADQEAALAAKDAAIDQMRRELEDLQSRLDQAEQTILHLTTSKAAELGVLRATIEDLTRQLEHLERQNQDLRNEVGRLTGEKASLEREVDKLREENRALRNRLGELDNGLAEKRRKLAQAEQTIADLQKLLNDLQRQGQKDSGASEAELAHLRSQLASVGRDLRGKEAEVDTLRMSLSLKEKQIAELQGQLAEVMRQRAELEERVRRLEEEKNKLEAELAQLRSQGRISKLASDDLQSKLTQVFGEREELARKLQLAEEALKDKEAANAHFQSLCDRLREQIAKLQQRIEELSHRSPPHTVTVTTHETATTHETTDREAKPSKDGKGASSTTMIFGSSSDSLLLTILQKLQELSAEISAGRADSSVATSSLSTKLEHLTQLQRHLEDSLRSRQSETEPPSTGANNTSYTAYYFMHGEEDDGESTDGEKRKSSTPKTTPHRLTSDLAAATAALGDATAQIQSLQSEVEDLKQWNSELQAKLDEDSDDGHTPHNYQQLEGEVDRLVAELDAERQRSQTDKAQQEQELNTLQDQLGNTEDKVSDLEHQLRLAMMRDAGTSTDGQTVDSLQKEVDRLVSELDQARATIPSLRGKLDAERNENHQLRSELSDIHTTTLSPRRVNTEAQASSSMPNLLAPKNLSDSWTSPARASVSMSERPDVQALKRRHNEVTRLNQELQRKCEEQLHRSPPSSRPGSASHSSSYWQGKLREQEDSLRSEMMERERSLLAEIRESESRGTEREAEWRQLETDLRRQIVDLEARLSEAVRSGEEGRRRQEELAEECGTKDEEIHNLSRSLSNSEEKVRALEEQLSQLLADKNSTISDLEERLRAMEEDLQRARESEERLRRTVTALEGGGAGAESEVTTLHETVDSLTQQLTSRIEDIEEQQRKVLSLEEQRAVLNSQLASAQEQILMLKEELALYQKLLDGGKSGGAQPSVEGEKMFRLLEEIRKLREQLDQSIHSNNALTEQLQSRLEQSRSETSIHYTSHTSPGSTQATPTQTSPRQPCSTQTTPPKRHTSRGTSPHVKMATRSTSTHVPLVDRGTGVRGGRSSTGCTRVTLHYDSESSGPHSLSETKLSDVSTSSLSQPHVSTYTPPSQRRTTAHTSTSNTTHTPPKDSSTPYSCQSDPSRSSTHHTSFTHTGTNTEGNPPPTDGREHTSTTSGYTHTKTTTTSRSGGADSAGGSPRLRRPTSGGDGGRRTTTFSWTGTGDFDSLETRLQQALNSPSLPAADRSFLEELLHYLRQQRKQLDESRKLLERLEQSTGIPSTTHIHVDTAESGTLPTHTGSQATSHTHTGSQSTPHTHTASRATPPLTTSFTHTASQASPHTHTGSQSTPRDGIGASAQTTPNRSSHVTSTYSFRSETSQVPRSTGSPGLGHGNQTSGGSSNRQFTQTHTSTGPHMTVTMSEGSESGDSVRSGGVAGGRAARVDLSKLYEQLSQTHSSLAEARSTLSHQKKQNA